MRIDDRKVLVANTLFWHESGSILLTSQSRSCLKFTLGQVYVPNRCKGLARTSTEKGYGTSTRDGVTAPNQSITSRARMAAILSASARLLSPSTKSSCRLSTRLRLRSSSSALSRFSSRSYFLSNDCGCTGEVAGIGRAAIMIFPPYYVPVDCSRRAGSRWCREKRSTTPKACRRNRDSSHDEVTPFSWALQDHARRPVEQRRENRVGSSGPERLYAHACSQPECFRCSHSTIISLVQIR